MSISSIMEKITGALVKDCFKGDDDVFYFVVATGHMGKALGKKAINVKKVQDAIGKKIRLIEFRDDVTEFVKNVVAPLKLDDVNLDGNQIIIKTGNKKTKSLLIGRGGKTLNLINRAVKRFFDVNEVKID